MKILSLLYEKHMLATTEKIIEAGLGDFVFNDVDLSILFNNTPASRYALINKALRKGELIRIRRGLYILNAKYRRTKLSLYYLANRIAPFSYISTESALAYHNWIPEQTKLITSVTATRATKFSTPISEFIYYFIPINEYEFFSQVNIDNTQPHFFIASPLRALADYIYIHKIDHCDLDFLENSLRIEKDHFKKFKKNDFETLKKVYHSKRVLTFIDNLQRSVK